MAKVKAISAKEWRESHPASVGAIDTDFYYAKLCTRLLEAITAAFDECEVPLTFARQMALQLGAYVEDAVTGLHIFEAFRRLNKEITGRKLPFYDLGEEYYDDEVNIQDVKLMIWNWVQITHGPSALINPDNVSIDHIALALMPIIDDAYEDAPESERLREELFDPEVYEGYDTVFRNLFWLLNRCPITAPFDIDEAFLEQEDELMDEYYEKHGDIDREEEPGLRLALFALIATRMTMIYPCAWLALPAQRWLTEMLRAEGMEAEADKVQSLEYADFAAYEIIDYDDEYINAIDSRTGKKYRILNQNINTEELAEGAVVGTSLASIGGDVWYAIGIPQILENYKSPDPEEYTVDGPEAYKYLTERLGGKRIGYFKDVNEVRERLLNGIPSDINLSVKHQLEQADGIVVFVNSDGTTTLSTQLAPTLSDPDNPYFKEIDKSILLSSIVSPNIASSELAQYIMRHGWYQGTGLTHKANPDRGVLLVQENMEFLMRWFRGEEFTELEPDAE